MQKVLHILLFFSLLFLLLAMVDYHYEGFSDLYCFKMVGSLIFAIIAYGITVIKDDSL